MHRWSDDDNLVGYCLCRFGKDVFGIDWHELGEALGMGSDSLSLKVANFKAIGGLGGMEQYSQQARKIAERYQDLDDAAVFQEGCAALQRASQGAIVSQASSPPVRSRQDLDAQRAAAQRQIDKLNAKIEKLRARK